MPEALQELLHELAIIPDAMEKLKFLLALGRDLEPLSINEKNVHTKISGCASNAYLIAEYKEEKMYFRGESDAQIPQGLLALFVFGLEGSPPQQILALSPDIFDQIGIKNLLSPARANGAYHMFYRIQQEAKKYTS